MDYSKRIPALPAAHPFTDVQADFWEGFYWSSTTAGWQAAEADLLYMQNGSLISGNKENSHWTWPVRGGAAPDLVIHDFEAPSTACGGQTIPITDVIGISVQVRQVPLLRECTCLPMIGLMKGIWILGIGRFHLSPRGLWRRDDERHHSFRNERRCVLSHPAG